MLNEAGWAILLTLKVNWAGEAGWARLAGRWARPNGKAKPDNPSLESNGRTSEKVRRGSSKSETI